MSRQHKQRPVSRMFTSSVLSSPSLVLFCCFFTFFFFSGCPANRKKLTCPFLLKVHHTNAAAESMCCKKKINSDFMPTQHKWCSAYNPCMLVSCFAQQWIMWMEAQRYCGVQRRADVKKKQSERERGRENATRLSGVTFRLPRSPPFLYGLTILNALCMPCVTLFA